jgi:galactonate dehydratase
MKITDIRIHTCFAMWRNWVFIEVVTDRGLVGVGEATLEGRELTVAGHVEDLRRALIGRDPMDLRARVRDLTRDPFWVGGYVAQSGLAAVEMAMWDIIGQELKVPVWQLLGGRVRDRIRVYANGWYFGVSTPGEWAERAGEVVELGYDAMKFDPFGNAGPLIDRETLDRSVAIVEAVRLAVGPKIDLMIEGHGRFDVHAAIRVANALAPFDGFWFEEPIVPGNLAALAEVRRASPIQIATGERLYSRYDYRELLTLGAAAVIQPDVIHAGGISETLAIAAMAETWMVPVAPHNPNGPVATAASLVVDAVAPNALIQEMLAPWDAHWRDAVVDGSPRVVDGHLAIPDRPGLGVRLVPEEIARHPYQPVDLGFFGPASVLDTVDLGEGRGAAGKEPAS